MPSGGLRREDPGGAVGAWVPSQALGAAHCSATPDCPQARSAARRGAAGGGATRGFAGLNARRSPGRPCATGAHQPRCTVMPRIVKQS